MELLDFKIVLAKSLIGTYNSRNQNTTVGHVSRWDLRHSSVRCTFQFFKQREENVDTIIL